MPRSTPELRVLPLRLREEVAPGDSLPELLQRAAKQSRQTFRAGDILVVKHKIVSKAEGRWVELEKVKPTAASRAWASRYGLDARVVEVALAESRRIVRRTRGVLITETRHGFICANSGVDVSNVNGGKHALLLPKDPDATAAKIHRALKKRLGVHIPVILADSFGRPWREGLTEAAIGVAGMKPLQDHRGLRDPHGYRLNASVDAVADSLACAAGLVCGKLERTPACIVRGFRYEAAPGSARPLLRPAQNDLFR
ncbi:MAG: coenzyme F420-0:L-glutamate ligase [Acidobacteria bacterium]|nr:coenzyme F420-0:L-glutamate ligase [Acidobacteriota bacterium]